MFPKSSICRYTSFSDSPICLYMIISIMYIYIHIYICGPVSGSSPLPPEIMMLPICTWIYTRLYKYIYIYVYCVRMYIYIHIIYYIYTVYEPPCRYGGWPWKKETSVKAADTSHSVSPCRIRRRGWPRLRCHGRCLEMGNKNHQFSREN